ncbi:uncharacterized protein LOC109397322 [Aedes albopictus]|uniref:Secreted protein n=1 Tax=Aedes albopictus TaxID=7160 RepID=A0ABM1Z448_AEDAL
MGQLKLKCWIFGKGSFKRYITHTCPLKQRDILVLFVVKKLCEDNYTTTTTATTMKYLISMLGLGLLLVFVTSVAESSLRNSLANSTDLIGGGGGANTLQKNDSCLILCNYCGCDGSFVGDDCVCDCGIDGEEHIKCLEKLESAEQEVDFETFEDEMSFIATQSGMLGRRLRREVDDRMERVGPGRKLNRKNKRKKVNRQQRGRGRRFLQMLTSGPNKNKE